MQSQTRLRQTITNTIIDALKNGGLPPWRKPWSDDPNGPGLHTSMSATWTKIRRCKKAVGRAAV